MLKDDIDKAIKWGLMIPPRKAGETEREYQTKVKIIVSEFIKTKEEVNNVHTKA